MNLLIALLLWPAFAFGQVFTSNVGVNPRPDAQIMFSNPVGTNHALIAGYQAMRPACQIPRDCNREVAFTGYGWDATGNYQLQIGSFRMLWAVAPTYPSGYGTVGMCAGRVYGDEVCPVQAFGDSTVTLFGNTSAPFQKPTGTNVMLWVNGAAPAAPNPNGVLLWVESGKLKAMNSLGITTVLTP